jgi:SAM-dependent methyltransferase
MTSLAVTPEAAREAAKFAVPPDIHADDFIYQHHIEVQTDPDPDQARARVIEYYFLDGNRSAQRLDKLIQEYHPAAGQRRLALLEFASGYGCVSRHLSKMSLRYDLVACDIHPEAIDFLQDNLGVTGVLSRTSPRDFTQDRNFDVVFCLSFFSHMPDRTFGDWIAALFATLADDGLLIFTTHGRQAQIDVGYPPLKPDGFWFNAISEQKDLPTEDYGTMVATPFYVMEQIARCPNAAVMFFQEAFWWGKQDLFIVRKVATDFRPVRTTSASTPLKQDFDPEVVKLREELARLEQRLVALSRESEHALHDALDLVHRSTSWRVTAPLRVLRTLISKR